MIASILLAAAAQFAGSAATDKPWAEIVGPSQAKLPPPGPEVLWRDDLRAALATAAAEDRPLFVTMRCVPCKQCADFDAAVLEGGSALDPLLSRFVTVRLTSVADVDLRLFPMEGFQDFDLSWWGWFLSPTGQVYSVFGGRDHVSDATRISTEALAATMRRVLEHHYDPRRAAWDVDGPPPKLDGPPPTPVKLPGFRSWLEQTPDAAKRLQCVHCHEVAEILRQEAIDSKSFDKRRDLDVWPLPENVGIALDRDDGLLVSRVEPGSPAARAGVVVGDRLVAAEGRKLFGQADFRGVLHRGPRGAGSIALMWTRGGELSSARLELADGWRATELGWRKSIAEGPTGAHPGMAWFFAAKPEDRRRLAISKGSMAIRPHFGPEPGWLAKQAGLTTDDVIVAVNGRSPDVSAREFLVWFRMSFEPGETIVYRVLDRRGREREVRFVAQTRGRSR